MSWLFAPNLTITHGFSTRWGGISPAPYHALNLGGHEDSPENILKNRTLALAQLGIELSQVAYLQQVHGDIVNLAQAGSQVGDALVTQEKGLALAISVADCYPILFYDAENQVIGAAHCGWRGTLAKIAAKTIAEMEKLGANANSIQVAIGQGICQANFEVGQEVIAEFAAANFPATCWNERYLDLVAANQFVLTQAGILPQHIWAMNRCTTESDFFSYRRDKGKTGRMWAIIQLSVSSEE